jgi:cell division septation protein DedD
LLAVIADRQSHRVQAGPFADRTQAQSALGRLGGITGLSPVIVEKK